MLFNVAPHAGAWIETIVRAAPSEIKDVAPHAGAWIETNDGMTDDQNIKVAPHAGAWIETCPDVEITEKTCDFSDKCIVHCFRHSKIENERGLKSRVRSSYQVPSCVHVL